VNCPSCQGKGTIEKTVSGPGVDAEGRMTTTQQSVREDCPHCNRGKVQCPPCSGNGKTTCGTCQGSGRVKTFDVLSVRFHQQTLTDVLDATAVPDHLIGGAQGTTIADENQPRIDHFPPVTAEADAKARALLQKSQAIDPQHSVLMFQQLRIQHVPVHEIVYRYGDPTAPEKRLWIYGDSQAVHAPGAPTNWGRLFLFFGLLFGIVAVLLLILLSLTG
jgi:hypothetical protein